MLFIDLVDFIFMLLGVLVGYVMFGLIHKDILEDECEDCEYREFIEEVLRDE